MSDDASSTPAKKERTPAQLAVFARLQAAIKEKRSRVAAEREPPPPPPLEPSPAPPQPSPPPPPKAPKRPHRVKKPLADIVREAVEEESSDSGSDDDEVSASGPLRELYKNKYQEKYRQKYSAKTTVALTKGVAHTALRSRVDDEMHRLARTAIFGS